MRRVRSQPNSICGTGAMHCKADGYRKLLAAIRDATGSACVAALPP
jgi:hypothetical protein